MRQLRKVIFVNSAHIRYQEILLDGNVHLIGTQGVGKSTILRTILFFYNADTQKLGIPAEKKPYAEYYYPHTNSWVLYEVQRETGNFTILSMRSGPGIAFRFIDAPFDQDWIIRDQQAKSSWQDIRITLDQKVIDYSNKIDRLSEYRDIIYGNMASRKAYRKYALLESKQYQNIPRTISNVFLNSKLEADFIKGTIINSLSEEPLAIDLTKYRHHLADFEKAYGDVQKFKDPKAHEQANAIINHYNTVLTKHAELTQKAGQLKDGLRKAEKTRENLRENLRGEEETKEETRKKLEAAQKRHEQQKDKHNANIKHFDQQIREARKKDREYRDKGIENILERENKQEEWKNEQKRLQEERKTLTAKFESIEQSYEVRIEQISNNQSELKNEREAEKNKSRENFYEQKEQAQQAKEGKIRELREELQNTLNTIDEEYQQVNEQRIQLREKKRTLEASEYYAEDLEKLDNAILQAQNRILTIQSEIKVKNSEVSQLQKDWQREEEQYKAGKEQSQTQLQQEKQAKKQQLESVSQKLDRYQSTLYGFLQANYPGWENTIGKVCREDVLFSEDLQPALQNNEGNLYGVQLNLENLQTSAKSLEAYEKEAKNLKERLNAIEKEIQETEQNFQQNLNNLKKRFQPKIREKKDHTQRLEAEQSGKEQEIEQKQLEKEDLTRKAKDEKQQALETLDGQIKDLDSQLQNLRQRRSDLNEAFEKHKKQKEKEFERALKQLQNDRDKELKAIDGRYDERIREEQARLENLKQQKTKALKQEGADTERLEHLDQRLSELQNELLFIEEHQQLVIEYRKDKRELIDKVDELKEAKSKEEQKLKEARERFEKSRQAYEQDIKEKQDAIDHLQKQLNQIEAGFEAFEQISQTDFFREEIQPQMTEGEEEGDPFAVAAYVAQIRDARNDLLERKRKLSETANRYLARFHDANLFNFNVNLIDDQDYMHFAADLKEFVDLNKIEELERRVNARFTDILSLVAKQTGDLISREGEIQDIISRINRDFREKNFVGVISSIEIKMEESADRVVNMMKRIREFDQEKGMALGEANLFNQGNADQENERAVELLKQLNQDLRDTRKERITLSDAFELRFRVMENENDTGWVEKLSNVGSEGTDILVKAMINIMLLNVFKESASRKFKDFKLHCMMDEIGRLHPGNVQGILKFANDRNILLINGSPVVQDAMAYRHIYELRKDQNSQTRIKRLVSIKEQTDSVENA